MDNIDLHLDKKIYFVLVLYNTLLEESKSFNSLTHSIKHFNKEKKFNLLIYDNSQFPQSINVVDFSQQWEIEYISDPSNPGVAKAYNKAAEIANNLNFEYILLLDQDTYFPLGTIYSYLTISESRASIFAPILTSNNIIVSPFRLQFYRGVPVRNVMKYGIYKLSQYQPINSGMMINLKAFFLIGGFNEKLGLDFSDIEFIYRANKKKIEFMIVPFIAIHDLSSTDLPEYSIFKERFIIYMRAIYDIKVGTIHKCMLYVYALARAIKYSFRYKNFELVQKFLKFLLNN